MMAKHGALFECDAVLFDLDGVLIDSRESVHRHWKEWAEAHGLDVDQIMRVAYGVRTVETMRRMAPHLDAEKEAAEFGAHEAQDTAGVVAIEGAARVLTALPADRWAIVTSCGAGLARARLRQARLPMPRVLVTSDDVQQGKPAPEPYLTAASRIGIPASRCAALEDSPAGIEAAKKAGMRAIGITTTHPREALLEKGADLVIDALADLIIRETSASSRLSLQLK
jgi:sugar-phosphatase